MFEMMESVQGNKLYYVKCIVKNKIFLLIYVEFFQHEWMECVDHKENNIGK